MILYEKHLAIMSLALFLIPFLARIVCRWIAKRQRIHRPGPTFRFILMRIVVAVLVPILAQGAFALLGARLPALAIAGAAYGALFGDLEDFPRTPAALWGALGGLAAGFIFGYYPPSMEARSLCVAVFAVAPLLAYRPLFFAARQRVGSAGLLTPSRRVLR
jgi:hypothetical protein